uniref:Uncharacterized protein n=1 Tax=viral metagenome TaxID=1070528 RepID=A0A6C0J5V3_9ZZZZ
MFIIIGYHNWTCPGMLMRIKEFTKIALYDEVKKHLNVC